MSLNIKVIFSAEGAPEIVSAIQKLRQEEQKLSTTTGATKRQFDKLGEALNKNTRATERLAESKEDASKKMGLFSRQLRGVRGSLAKFRSITLIAAFTVNMFDRTLGALTRAAKFFIGCKRPTKTSRGRPLHVDGSEDGHTSGVLTSGGRSMPFGITAIGLFRPRPRIASASE